MTSLPAPTRPFRITVTTQRVEDLRRLAANADGFVERAIAAGDHADARVGAVAVDLLRWLSGEEPADYLTEILAD
jgi:hypothetical protein